MNKSLIVLLPALALTVVALAQKPELRRAMKSKLLRLAVRLLSEPDAASNASPSSTPPCP